jgi:hypothetical protein
MTGFIAYVPHCMTGFIVYVPHCMTGLIAFVLLCMLLGLEKKKLLAVAENWSITVTVHLFPSFISWRPALLLCPHFFHLYPYSSTSHPYTACCLLLVSSLCPVSPNVKAFTQPLECCA